MFLLKPLNSSHRDAVSAHLLALSAADRHKRFMAVVNDAYIVRYAAALNPPRDLLTGAFDGRQLLAFMHAAVCGQGDDSAIEIGLSVQPGWRRQGLGRQLCLAAIGHAQRLCVPRLLLLFRTDNRAMGSLMHSLGAQIEHDGMESCATLEVSTTASSAAPAWLCAH